MTPNKTLLNKIIFEYNNFTSTSKENNISIEEKEDQIILSIGNLIFKEMSQTIDDKAYERLLMCFLTRSINSLIKPNESDGK